MPGARAILKEFLAGVNHATMHEQEVFITIIKTGHFVLKKSTFIFARWPQTRMPPYWIVFRLSPLLCAKAPFPSSAQFCVREKFETSPVAERAVIGGFTHRDFYAQRQVLVPCTLPVFIMLYFNQCWICTIVSGWSLCSYLETVMILCNVWYTLFVILIQG